MEHLSKEKMDAMTPEERNTYVRKKLMEILESVLTNGGTPIKSLTLVQKIYLFGNLYGALVMAEKNKEVFAEEYKEFFRAFVCKMCNCDGKNFIEFLYDIQDASMAFKHIVHRFIERHNEMCPELSFSCKSCGPEEYAKHREDLKNQGE